PAARAARGRSRFSRTIEARYWRTDTNGPNAAQEESSMVYAPAAVTADQLTRLRDAFAGEIVTPADEGYDEARRLWNAVHDLRPAAVLRPTTSAEVATAIRFARDNDLP